MEPRAYLFACGFKEHISDRQTSLGSRGVFMAKYRESKCSAILMHQNLASLTSAFGDPGEDKRTAWLSQSY